MKSLRKFSLLFMLFMSAILLAQGKPKLEIDIREAKVNMTAKESNGTEPVSYTPGDTILYTIYAKNTGDALMTDPMVLDPIPEDVEYVVDSATGENCRILFSVNTGSQFSVWPVMVTGTAANGTPIRREAKNEEVTHIKWMVQDSIPAGGQKVLTFKVVVK